MKKPCISHKGMTKVCVVNNWIEEINVACPC